MAGEPDGKDRGDYFRHPMNKTDGAVVGDFLDKPVAAGGLALSRYSASLTLALIIVAFLWLLPQRPAMKVAVTN